MMKITWRDHYTPEQLAAIARVHPQSPTGGIDIHETVVEDWVVAHGGHEVAEEIARQQNLEDGESFRDGGTLVILTPASVAGTYALVTEYEPVFYASRRDDEATAPGQTG